MWGPARSPSSSLCVALPSVWPSPPHSNPPLHLMHPKQTAQLNIAPGIYLHPSRFDITMSVWHHLFTCDKGASSLGSAVAAPQSICSSCCWTGGPVWRETQAHQLSRTRSDRLLQFSFLINAWGSDMWFVGTANLENVWMSVVRS